MIMLKSLYLYSKYTSKIFFKADRKILFSDFKRRKKGLPEGLKTFSLEEKNEALKRAASWVLYSQSMMKDDGIGSYHLANSWTSSYPETTGYLIPSMLDYAKFSGNDGIPEKMIKATDWLISIQKESGGWQGGRMDDNWAEVVFNTGQIIRGMISAYQFNQDQKYLEAAKRAGDWLVTNQEEDGTWQKFASMNQKRVYDSYVDTPLIELGIVLGEDKYSIAAKKNLDWIIQNKQRENGWFDDCDNTTKRNSKPILHTISYTIDGLFDSGKLLGEEKYIIAAKKAADVLLQKFQQDNYLNGRFDENWNGSEYLLVTGCAQISIIWLKLYQYFNDNKYLDAAIQMNEILVAIQDRGDDERPETNGAMPGSFPIWGRYEPFAFPNWATKYFIDTLLLELELTK